MEGVYALFQGQTKFVKLYVQITVYTEEKKKEIITFSPRHFKPRGVVGLPSIESTTLNSNLIWTLKHTFISQTKTKQVSDDACETSGVFGLKWVNLVKL